MRYEQNSSIVFVGEFPSVFIDEREIFGGQVDGKNLVRAGPVLQCTFAAGRHEILSTPDRISIKTFSDTIMPDDLIEAAELVASRMDSLAAAIKTTDMGFNFDGAIRQSALGKRGIDYCRDLITDKVARIAGNSDFSSKCAIAFLKGGLQYNIRIEPHARSSGEDLFFAVNGHQKATSGDYLLDKVSRYRGGFVENTQALLDRLESKAVG